MIPHVVREISPKLDAVETDEVGLSIAFPEEQSGCAGKKAENKITDDTNAYVRDTKNPMVNTALPPILRWRRCFCSNVMQSFQNLADAGLQRHLLVLPLETLPIRLEFLH